MAQRNGMTPEQYIKHAQEVLDRQADQAEYDKLIAAGNKPETAEELLKLRRETTRKGPEEGRRPAAGGAAADGRAPAGRRAEEPGLRGIVKAYPEVKVLPPEVAQAVAAGETS